MTPGCLIHVDRFRGLKQARLKKPDPLEQEEPMQ